jgi:uncharacterized protein YbbC (DUF1343 family)/CubicO group peptidase (beta-lactamase class C family)
MKRYSPNILVNFLFLFLMFTEFWQAHPAMATNLWPLPRLREEQLAPIADLIEQAIADGKTPGAVVLIGNDHRVVYRRAFGLRALQPEKLPMTADTIFDVASLTKAVATTTAVMQLIEKGRIGIDQRVARYWPAFAKNGKSAITIRQLLTHYSGLRPGLDQQPSWSGYQPSLQKILDERPATAPGSAFIYSDINFAILGHLVRRLTGQPLDQYCDKQIFRPLGMKDTRFNPGRHFLPRIAPTEFQRGEWLVGKVHDPTAFRMGGVSGHAGLFSTADDLAIFAEMLLEQGRNGEHPILLASTVDQMTSPQSPPDRKRLYGLGWDIDAGFIELAGEVSPKPSYDHLGYTGTALWIDPSTRTYVILLTNRVHPNGRGDVKALRSSVKLVVAKALVVATQAGRQATPPRPAPALAADRQTQTGAPDAQGLRTGIDVLVRDRFAPLSGMRIGLITNHTGVDGRGKPTLELLRHAPGVRLTAIFSPEHGLTGTVDALIPSSLDKATGLPVYSLYGSSKKPTAAMLKDLDGLVFDIQDAGVRFYTYISTMGYAMEAAAESGLAFFVLDRPNPLTAAIIQGPVPDKPKRSFTEYFPLPVRHGMTVGELAVMFNTLHRIGADLRVIKMEGYDRSQWFDETGMAWINPSPNLRSLTEATLYPGVALAEGANVSVGRGTSTPFELLGAPWIDGKTLAGVLNGRHIAGVRFAPAEFTPDSDIYRNRHCGGVQITLTDRRLLDSPLLGIEILAALYRLYPRSFTLDDTLGLVGDRSVLTAIKEGRDPQAIARSCQGSLEAFLSLRARFLLYGEMPTPVSR